MPARLSTGSTIRNRRLARPAASYRNGSIITSSARPLIRRPAANVLTISRKGGASARVLRIAHASPSYFASHSVVGGGERYVVYLARALDEAAQAAGLDISQTILACGPRDETFAYGAIPVRIMRNTNPRGGAMDATADRLTRELACVDLVHVHQALTTFGAFATVAAKSLGKRIVATDLGGGENRTMLEAGGLRLADGVLSISRYARSLVAAYTSAPHEVLVGPVDTASFPPPDHPRVHGARRRVIAVGRILPHKGYDRIIAALPAGMSLTIVGRPYHADYLAHLHRLAEGADVIFVHDADDRRLLDLLHAADLFVQASTGVDCYGNISARPELMGLTTLEAMSTGLPVLVSDAGSLPELVADPRFGRVFHDHAELARNLDDAASGAWPDPDAASLAHRYVVSQHGFHAIGERLADFYRRIMVAACAS